MSNSFGHGLLLLLFPMKKIVLSVCFSFFFIFSGFCQGKYDYIWTLGYGQIAPSPSGYPYGGIIMDFNTNPPSLTLQDYPFDRPKASIADKNGHLVAYTNGCMVVNRNHQLMSNGDTLSPGAVFEEFCEQGDYPLTQPTIFLPKPGNDSVFYLFHLRDDDWLWNPMNLMYSIIEVSSDAGDGIVSSKNNSILTDSIYLGNYITATRHGNGRDWWIVTPRRFSNGFHISSLTANGVEYKGLQNIATEPDSAYWGSQTTFSTNGSKYFRNSKNGLLMLDFDRCSGVLSNPIYLDWDSLPFGGGGVATSPNSRFLYLTSGGTVQQYDLWAPNLAASMQVVAVYDGTLAPFPANFFQMMPGPDGKIYIITSHDNNVLHVIHHPDSLGLACMVEQHAITLPARQSYFIPNFANYNLGPLDPPCDSTSGVGEAKPGPAISVLQVSPNPTAGLVSLSLPQANGGQLWVYHANGQLLKTIPLPAETLKLSLDLSPYPSGLYWVLLKDSAGKSLGSAKISVIHP